VGEPRRQLLGVFEAALAAVNGRRCVADYLAAHPLAGPVYGVAVGKAAAPMAAGAFDALGNRLAALLAITKTGHCPELIGLDGRVRCLESSHPVPDASSLAAGAELLRFIQGTPRDASLLVLTSGGASSLVEHLAGDLGPAQLAGVNRWLLGSGMDIHGMNRVRKALSRIKGGRLAVHLGGRNVLNLVISDVPGDDLRSIGSGLLVPHGPADVSLQGLHLPDWLAALTESAEPLPDEAAFDRVQSVIVARSADAQSAAARRGEALGYAVHGHDALLCGDAYAAGRRVVAELLSGVPGLYVWGGETTVRLPPNPGRGGRCQGLALAAALQLRGHGGVWLLAAGTDGTDGPGLDAGALVDGQTVSRGEDAGLDADQALARADAGTFLEASEDLLRTGPTGTNVMDLVLALKLPERAQ
jgi:glycerate 2-kinase